MSKAHECQVGSVGCHEKSMIIRRSRGDESEAKYTLDDLKSALNELGKGVSLSKIALKYNIPKSTLFRKSKDNPSIGLRGPPSVLTEAEERHITEWISYRKGQGFPVTQKKIIDYVQKYLNSNNRKTIFKNNKPGIRWCAYFLKRHLIFLEGQNDGYQDEPSAQHHQEFVRVDCNQPSSSVTCRIKPDVETVSHVTNHTLCASNSSEFDATNSSMTEKENHGDGKYTKYTVEDLRTALNELGKGISMSQIALKYGIPKSTLSRKSKNLTPIICKRGPPTILTEAEEKQVASWIGYRIEKGYPVSRKKIVDYVQRLLNNSKKKTPFKNNKPGIHWYKSFMKRQSIFSVRGVPILKCEPSMSIEGEESEEEQNNTSDFFAPPSSQPEEPLVNQNSNLITNILKFFENHLIGADLLQNFESTYEEMGVTEPQGISQEALFEVWCELQRMKGKESRHDNIVSQEGVFGQSQSGQNKLNPGFIYVINSESDRTNEETPHIPSVHIDLQREIPTIHIANQDHSMSNGAVDDSVMNWNPQLSSAERTEVAMLESQRQKRDEELERRIRDEVDERKKVLTRDKNKLHDCESSLNGLIKEIKQKLENGRKNENERLCAEGDIFKHLYGIEDTLLVLVKQGLYRIDSEERACS